MCSNNSIKVCNRSRVTFVHLSEIATVDFPCRIQIMYEEETNEPVHNIITHRVTSEQRVTSVLHITH